MTPARIRAVARKELLHVVRDPRSLAMAIAIPMLLLILFGYALTLDVDRVPLTVWDQSRSTASRDLVARFSGSRYFALQGVAGTYADLVRAIDRGDALVALVIPADFADRLGVGRQAPVQVIADGADANTATIALAYVDAIAGTYSRDVVVDAVRRAGRGAVAVPVDVRPRAWFNPELESRNYIVPGLIAVIMMVIAALLTSLTVAREWERGTMEQLISTPVSGPELVIGKLLPYFAIGMLDVFLAVAMGTALFGVTVRGSHLLLFSVAAVFLVGALSLGLVISIVTKSQLLASQLAMVLTFLPSFLLSGFMYSIANMPVTVQAITYLVPARYFVALLKGIYLKGVGVNVLAVEVLLLTAFGAGVLLVAIRRFDKKLV
jgi:ABC-2 type transport system permease protein